MFRLLVTSSAVIFMSCSFSPGMTMVLMLVATITVPVAGIVTMFGAVEGYFKPIVALGIPLHDPLVGVACVGAHGASGLSSDRAL